MSPMPPLPLRPRKPPRDLRALLCVAVFLGCLLLSYPFAEVGVLYDDWAYIYTARALARTGHLLYPGWGAMPLVLQAGWAALWIRLLGFSFTVARVSTYLFSGGAICLLYGLHRRAGLNPSLAVFGTLTICLSPLFLALGSSFMTDLPALFCFLLSLTLYLRAFEEQAAHGGSYGGWVALVAATVVGVAGGAERQTVWVVPIACLGISALRERRQPWGKACATLLATSLVAIGGILGWFHGEPHTNSADPGDALRFVLHHPAASLVQVATFLLPFPLIFALLPVFLGADPIWRGLRALPKIVVGGFVAVSLLIPLAASRAIPPWLGAPPHNAPCLLLEPFARPNGIITAWGVTDPMALTLGRHPLALPRPLWALLSSVVYLAFFAIVACAWKARVGCRAALVDYVRRAPSALYYLLAVDALYILILLPLLPQGGAYDRSLLPLLPAVTIILLRWHQDGRTKPGEGQATCVCVAGWVGLTLLAGYGVAILHDYFAQTNARLQAAHLLERAGVPRTQIIEGEEFDAWTIYEARRQPPRSGVWPDMPPLPTGYAMSWRSPQITPRYLIVVNPLPDAGLLRTPFPTVSYTTFLPPYGRSVAILQAAAPEAGTFTPESDVVKGKQR